jgi:hypothetical protein
MTLNLARRVEEPSNVVPLERAVNLTLGGTVVNPIVVQKSPAGYLFQGDVPTEGSVIDNVLSAYQQEMVRASGYKKGLTQMGIGDLLNFVWGTKQMSDFQATAEQVLEYTQKQLARDDNPVRKEELLAYAVGNMLAYRHGKLELN